MNAPTGARWTLISATVFLGCRNITCALCRSLSHLTTSCPQVNPTIPAGPGTAQPKSTSYVPCSATINADPDSKGSSRPRFSVAGQVCHNFNGGKCSIQRCKFLHACNYCSGAHARLVCPVYKAVNKNKKTTYRLLVLLRSIKLRIKENY